VIVQQAFRWLNAIITASRDCMCPAGRTSCWDSRTRGLRVRPARR